MTPNDFINKIAPIAQANFSESKIWPSFTIVQAIFESSWGASEECIASNNLFGIKADSSWQGPIFAMQTEEYVNGAKVMQPANWRSYPDWQSSVDDHAAFLQDNPRYALAFQTNAVNDFIQAIAAAGYSTNPNYAKMLINEIAARNLTQYDKVQP